ncbi:hypothetical protein [Methylobacter sp.]|uniref:hypothetical protein n=1 Tax=Methylobacter sp. TaxID=2051955 RepID=UPI003DA25E46
MMPLMKRRKFLGLILTAAAGSLAYKKFYYDFSLTDEFDENIRTYVQNFGLQLKGARFKNSSVDQIAQLEAKLISRNWHNLDTEEAFYDRISEITREEFLAGKIVDIDGWIVSEFERDMILYALLVKNKQGVQIKEEINAFQNAVLVDFLNIKDWGPQSTCVDMGFNQQSDGHSSHWFLIGPYTGLLRVYINGTLMPTTKGIDVLTTKIEGKLLNDLISNPGKQEVMIYDPSRNLKQRVGFFEIFDKSRPAVNEEGHESKHFGVVQGWGPKSLPLEQFLKGDKSPLWITSHCAPRDSVILVGDTPLNTTVGSTLVSGLFSVHQKMINAGSYPVFLYSRQNNEKVKVGIVELSN